jgi:hypothetical protein
MKSAGVMNITLRPDFIQAGSFGQPNHGHQYILTPLRVNHPLVIAVKSYKSKFQMSKLEGQMGAGVGGRLLTAAPSLPFL